MEAQYISSIEIKALWKGGRRVRWQLQPDVNILSGINGVGKSTIINHSVRGLQLIDTGELHPGDMGDNVSITLFPAEATSVRFDVIRSFDRPLLHSDLLEKLSDSRVKTELDWQIYRLQKRYLDYQTTTKSRMIEVLMRGEPNARQQAADMAHPQEQFQDLVDSLFTDTGKKLDRRSNEIAFLQDGEELSPYKLSSGEKQMIVILTTVLVEDRKPYVLLMDEPEISLHIDWQQHLIENIRLLNPHAQIILSTHSPAVIMEGWRDCVTEVAEIAH